MLADNHETIYERSLETLTAHLKKSGYRVDGTYPYLAYMGNWMADFSQLYSPEITEKIYEALTVTGTVSDPLGEAAKKIDEGLVDAAFHAAQWLANKAVGEDAVKTLRSRIDNNRRRVERLKTELDDARRAGDGEREKRVEQALVALARELAQLDVRQDDQDIWDTFASARHTAVLAACFVLSYDLFHSIASPFADLMRDTAAFADLLSEVLGESGAMASPEAKARIGEFQYVACLVAAVLKSSDLANLHLYQDPGHPLAKTSNGYYARHVPVATAIELFVDHFGIYLPHEHLDRAPLPGGKTEGSYAARVRPLEQEARDISGAPMRAIPITDPLHKIHTLGEQGPRPLGVDRVLRDDVGLALRRLYEMREHKGPGAHPSGLSTNARLLQTGKSLHAIQDYFAHTNAIDRMIYLSRLDMEPSLAWHCSERTRIYRSLITAEGDAEWLKAERLYRLLQPGDAWMEADDEHPPVCAAVDLEDIMLRHLSALVYPAFFDPSHDVLASFVKLAEDKIIKSLELDGNLQPRGNGELGDDVIEAFIESVSGFRLKDEDFKLAHGLEARAQALIDASAWILRELRGGRFFRLFAADDETGDHRIVTVDALVTLIDEVIPAARAAATDEAEFRRVVAVAARGLDILLLLPFLLQGLSDLGKAIERIGDFLAAVKLLWKILKIVKAIIVSQKIIKRILSIIGAVLGSTVEDIAKAVAEFYGKELVKMLFAGINHHLTLQHGSHSLMAKDESIEQEIRYDFAEDMAAAMDRVCYDFLFGVLPPMESPSGAGEEPQGGEPAHAMRVLASLMAELTCNALSISKPPEGAPVVPFSTLPVIRPPGGYFTGWQARMGFVVTFAGSREELNAIIATSGPDPAQRFDQLDATMKQRLARTLVAVNEETLVWGGESFFFSKPPRDGERVRFWCFAAMPAPPGPVAILQDHTAVAIAGHVASSVSPAGWPGRATGQAIGLQVRPWYAIAGESYGAFLRDRIAPEERLYPEISLANLSSATGTDTGFKRYYANELFRLNRDYAAMNTQRVAEAMAYLETACPNIRGVLGTFRTGWPAADPLEAADP